MEVDVFKRKLAICNIFAIAIITGVTALNESLSNYTIAGAPDNWPPKSSIEEHPDSIFRGMLVIIIVSIVVAIVSGCAVVALLVYCVNRHYNDIENLIRKLTDKEVKDFFKGIQGVSTNATADQIEIVESLPYNTNYEVSKDDLEFDTSINKELGSGQFAKVVRGKLISKELPVAIKIPTSSADATLFKSLLSEVKIMIYIGKHENVVALVGVCTQEIRNCLIYIVTEICELGSMYKFLREARPFFINLVNVRKELDKSLLTFATGAQSSFDVITTLDLIQFAGQIANGMEYLSSKSVVHADLATRNVLLTKDKVAKISDFGLSKKLFENKTYVKHTNTYLPWPWMAVESLNTLKFSTESDIWAYGVTLFEVFTLGDAPFPNEDYNEAFCNRLNEGMRLDCPKYSTIEIYNNMLACWENNPTNRPTFERLKLFFEATVKEYLKNTFSVNPDAPSDRRDSIDTYDIDPVAAAANTNDQSAYLRLFF